MAFVYILAATLVVGLIALVGAFSLMMSRSSLEKVLVALVGLSAGTLLSGAFFHLIGEALAEMPANTVFGFVFAGFVLFFLIERVFHWHHCHKGECETHAFSYLILLGDGIHNFIDGLVIAASFLVDTGFGIVTTVLIIGHEIPQELGDFGVLVYGGFSRMKALAFNFLSQLTCVAGGIVGFFVLQGSAFPFALLPLAAGGFIYIAASDLVPELHKETSLRKAVISCALFIIGIVFMFGVKVLFG